MDTTIIIRQRRHVLAEDLTYVCPYAPQGKYIPCVWSDGKDCNVAVEHARDCDLNSPEDAATCKEVYL